MQKLSSTALAVAVAAVCSASASAAVIQNGLYRLSNHPDGAADPPPYGARFDELYDVTSGHDIFTLDFNDINSLAQMTVDTNAGTIRIFGQSFGGRDIGATYANDVYRGIYTFDFLYNIGVGQVPGDDDLRVVTPDHRNFGTILTPLGDTINLTDEADSGFTFRLGDEDNDAGHRGFNGISGWGWMSYVRTSGIQHIANTDWIFTATFIIPSPGAAALLGLAGLTALRRRR